MSNRARQPDLAVGAVVLAIVMLVQSATCRAQQPADPVAVELKRTGDVAIEAGKFQEALDSYTKALAIESSAALHYNRGRALQGLGRNSEALSEFEHFEREAPPPLRAAVPDFDAIRQQVRKQVAEVSIECDVPDATVRVLGKVLSLPLRAPLRFEPATIEFEIVAPGYESWHRHATLLGGDTQTFKPKLSRQDLRGTLLVASPVSGATVQVDGKAIGAVPVELRLTPGEHDIEVRHAGYRNARSRVVLRPTEHRSLSVSLDALPRWYEAWWFWTATGAAVATGIIAGVALSTEKSPGSGDIPPGRITAPLRLP